METRTTDKNVNRELKLPADRIPRNPLLHSVFSWKLVGSSIYRLSCLDCLKSWKSNFANFVRSARPCSELGTSRIVFRTRGLKRPTKCALKSNQLQCTLIKRRQGWIQDRYEFYNVNRPVMSRYFLPPKRPPRNKKHVRSQTVSKVSYVGIQ